MDVGDRDILYHRLAYLLDDDAQSHLRKLLSSNSVDAQRNRTYATHAQEEHTGRWYGIIVRGCLVQIAQLGGSLVPATDTPPGNTLLWRGLARLSDIQMGSNLETAQYVVGNCKTER